VGRLQPSGLRPQSNQERVMIETNPFLRAVPLFDVSKIELPKLDVPAYREFVEKGLAQAKDAYEKVKAAAEGAVGLSEEICLKATKSTAELNRQVIEVARANANAAFDYAAALAAVKSPAEAVELSAEHARAGFTALAEQSKTLGGIVQKLATDAAEPITAGVDKVFKQAA
jgi:phasin